MILNSYSALNLVLWRSFLYSTVRISFLSTDFKQNLNFFSHGVSRGLTLLNLDCTHWAICKYLHRARRFPMFFCSYVKKKKKLMSRIFRLENSGTCLLSAWMLVFLCSFVVRFYMLVQSRFCVYMWFVYRLLWLFVLYVFVHNMRVSFLCVWA